MKNSTASWWGIHAMTIVGLAMLIYTTVSPQLGAQKPWGYLAGSICCIWGFISYRQRKFHQKFS